MFKNTCPLCRRPNFRNSLVRLPFLEEIKEEFEKLTPEELCTEHSLSLDYYCETCSSGICGDCVAIGSHSNHIREKIGVIYQGEIEEIRREQTKLEHPLQGILKNMRKVKKRISRIKDTAVEQKKEAEALVNRAMERFQNQVVKNMEILEQYRGELKMTKESTAAFQAQIEDSIVKLKKCELVDRTSQILTDIAQKNKAITVTASKQMPSVLKTEPEIIPEFEEITQNIEIKLLTQSGHKITGRFDAYGKKWEYEIMNSYFRDPQSGFIDIQLAIKTNYNNELFDIKFLVMSLSRTSGIYRTFKEHFGAHPIHRFQKVAAISRVIPEIYLDSANRIDLVLGVRPSSYYQMLKCLGKNPFGLKTDNEKLEQSKKSLEIIIQTENLKSRKVCESNRQLSTSILELKQENNQISAVLHQAQSEQSQLKDIREQLDTRTQSLEHYKQELSLANQKISQISEYQDENAEAQRKIATLTKALKDAELQLTEIPKLMKKIETFKSIQSGQDRKFNEFDSIIKTQVTGLRQYQDNLNTLQLDIEDKNKLIEDLQSQLERANRDRANRDRGPESEFTEVTSRKRKGTTSPPISITFFPNYNPLEIIKDCLLNYKNNVSTIKITFQCNAIRHLSLVAETIKRHERNLHQLNTISSTGQSVQLTLSKFPLNQLCPGYQAPLHHSLVFPLTEDQINYLTLAN